MKRIIASIVLAVTATVGAVPTTNTYVSVTNDWYNGNWSNVYELAQARFSANSNDLVAATIMVDYDVLFSDFHAMSNSIIRLTNIAHNVSLPAYTNIYQKLRPGWEFFLDEFLPRQTEVNLQDQRTKSYIIHKPMSSDFILDILWQNGMW